MGSVPALVDRFIKSDFLAFVDNGKPPRSDYGLREYDHHKIGMVQHITAGGRIITHLDNYFLGGNAAGSSHFGIGRETAGYFDVPGGKVPVAPVHQYMPTVGRYAPWAQGVRAWENNSACSITVPDHLRKLPPAAANPAFLSVENVAVSGSEGVTDAQFNSNVLLRAWGAAYFDYEITPETQLWHAEFSPLTRCFDPGWRGELEDAMQEAARKLLKGDASDLRALVRDAAPAPQEKDEEPVTANEAQVRAIVRDEIQKSVPAITGTPTMERLLESLVLRLLKQREAMDYLICGSQDIEFRTETGRTEFMRFVDLLDAAWGEAVPEVES